MRSADGNELDPVLDEQATYYQAIAGEYYDQYLNLPAGQELIAALDASARPAACLSSPAGAEHGPVSFSATQQTSPL